MSQRKISEQQVAFLKFEIETIDVRRQKAALQDICRLYRQGSSLSPEARRDLEVHASYLANNSPDHKVVRWALNTIARLGTLQGAANSVEDALRRHAGSPEIVAAAVAALAALYKGKLPALPSGAEVPPELKTLAALQTVSAAQLGEVQLNIDIETADTEVLKLALIVIGLNRDIQNLLHPRHENGEIVRALGQHDDTIVRQYGVWAVIENRRLGLEHLGTALEGVEKEPENVQAKLLELGASSIPDLTHRQEFIICGSNLSSTLAREGLAKGLIHSFHDGLEGVTLEWFRTEQEPRVTKLLAEHFARFSDRLPSYEEKAIELAGLGGDFKRHVLLGADGKPLMRKLQGQNARQSDMFGALNDGTEGFFEMVRLEGRTKVLVLNATPDNLGRIRPDREAAELRDRMAAMPSPTRPLAFEHIWATRLDQIQQELIRQRPAILHFSGHGAPGVLAFEDREGNSVELRGEMLARILNAYGGIECLVLHACYSDDVAAECLQHVRAVVGSTDAVDDVTAPAFSYIFYQAVAGGMSYEQSFIMGQTEVAILDEDSAKAYKLRTR